MGNRTYTGQGFFRTDCFYESGLKVGDQVLVVCYDYDDDYSIPGGQSLLQITGLEDPLVTSIRKYIDADEHPAAIRDDIGLWATQNLGRALERIIECEQEAATGQESLNYHR